MSDINHVVLCGRLTHTPELKHGGSGNAYCKFSIANNVYAGQGKEQKVNFFNVTVFGKRAESVCTYLNKGSQVIVDGKLDWNTWQDKDGQKRSTVGVIAAAVQFIGGKSNSKNQSQPGPEPADDLNVPDNDNASPADKTSWESPVNGDDDIPF